ncbi:hypothetical protein Btru_031615 [Bulinus truncatus]|nr:hypothetical protein Btru_031615 [Bulinus truncatus]
MSGLISSGFTFWRWCTFNNNHNDNKNNDNDKNNNDNVNKNNVENNKNDNVNKNNVDNNNNDNDKNNNDNVNKNNVESNKNDNVNKNNVDNNNNNDNVNKNNVDNNNDNDNKPETAIANRYIDRHVFFFILFKPIKMAIKREVALGTVRGLSEFWKSEELQDFTVTVGSTQDFIYTGHGVLTNDNVIDIWHATNQLQIQFLIEECETFVKGSLSLNNCEQYLCHAKLLNGKDVLETIWNFIKQNFNSFSKTDSLLDLSVSVLLDVVKSQDLKVESEDVVIESIVRWIDNDPSSQYVHDSQRFDERSLSDISNVDKKVALESKTNGDLKIVTQTQFSASHSLSNDTSSSGDVNMSAKIEDEPRNEENGSNERPGADSLQNSDKEAQTANQPDKLTNDSRKKRSDYLVTLLLAARTSLASTECLEKTMKLPMILENAKARDIILKTLFYNIHRKHRNGQWSSSAIWRNCAQLENVAVCCVNDYSKCLTELTAFSFTKNKWFKLNRCPDNKYHSICLNVDNKLNLFNIDDRDHWLHWHTLDTYSFRSISLDTVPYEPFLAEVIDNNVYIMTSTNAQLFNLNTSTRKLRTINIEIEPNSRVQHMTTFSNYLLIFYSESIDAADRSETVVQCFDTLTQTVNRLSNLEGPAERMTSFKNDLDTFILQGDLWKIVQPQSDAIDFELVAKLWTKDWRLYGAVTFFDDLYIFGVQSLQNVWGLKRNLLGYFPQIHYVEHPDNDCSALVPTVVNRDVLLREKSCHPRKKVLLLKEKSVATQGEKCCYRRRKDLPPKEKSVATQGEKCCYSRRKVLLPEEKSFTKNDR